MKAKHADHLENTSTGAWYRLYEFHDRPMLYVGVLPFAFTHRYVTEDVDALFRSGQETPAEVAVSTAGLKKMADKMRGMQ